MRILFFVLFLFCSTFTCTVYGNHSTLLMGTTTSTDNTGLLDYLAPAFQKDTGIELKWVAVGTGKALQLGKHCDVSVLLVHAPALEKAFVRAGYGIHRLSVMYNDFVIVGPKNDPAHIKNLPISQALKKLVQLHAIFVSRADNSGTYQKELEIWKAAKITPPIRSPYYLQAGQGMMATLRIAAEKNAYTLTDRGTFISYETVQHLSPLRIIVQGDICLRNPYSVIVINPKYCPNTSTRLATQFADWITSKKTQALINNYTKQGQKLFIANASH